MYIAIDMHTILTTGLMTYVMEVCRVYRLLFCAFLPTACGSDSRGLVVAGRLRTARYSVVDLPRPRVRDHLLVGHCGCDDILAARAGLSSVAAFRGAVAK